MWTLGPGALLIVNTAYCIIKIKDDFANARPGLGLFGIFAAIGAAAILAWLAFLLALAHSGV